MRKRSESTDLSMTALIAARQISGFLTAVMWFPAYLQRYTLIILCDFFVSF